MKLTLDQTEQLAQHITFMQVYLEIMDIEVLQQAAIDMKEAASWYDSAAVLNRNWNEYHGKVLQEKAENCKLILMLKKSVSKIRELTAKEEEYKKAQEDIDNMFL